MTAKRHVGFEFVVRVGHDRAMASALEVFPAGASTGDVAPVTGDGSQHRRILDGPCDARHRRKP
jgi:hypothetical protein